MMPPWSSTTDVANLSIDKAKVRQKLQFIRQTVAQLETLRARGRQAFLSDPILQAAAIRYLQVGIEAMLDIAHHIVAREGLGLPGSYREAIELLLGAKVLPPEQRSTFLAMIRFRNRAVHLYDDIDPTEVYGIMDEHLKDFEDFAKAIVRRYFASP